MWDFLLLCAYCFMHRLASNEIDELKTAIENNTLVIQQLIQSLGKRGE